VIVNAPAFKPTNVTQFLKAELRRDDRRMTFMNPKDSAGMLVRRQADLDDLLEQVDAYQELADSLHRDFEAMRIEISAVESHPSSRKSVKFRLDPIDLDDPLSSYQQTAPTELAEAQSKIAAERRMHHAKLEKTLRRRQQLTDNIESQRNSLRNCEKLICDQSEQIEQSRRYLASLRQVIDDPQSIQVITAKISSIEKKLGSINTDIAICEKQSSPKRSKECSPSRLEAVRARNRELESELASITRRHSRLAPLVHKWRLDVLQSNHASDCTRTEDIDELLSAAEENAQATQRRSAIQSPRLDDRHAALSREIQEFRSEEKRLIAEIESERVRAAETEAGLVDDIVKLRIKIAQQRLRHRARQKAEGLNV
jgi:hypothetical protein